MRIVTTGGRRYERRDVVSRTLMETFSSDRPKTLYLVANGGASGADRLVEQWCRQRSFPFAKFLADWDSHGPAAGPIRNGHMIDIVQPDLVIAFPGGNGTADCVRRAERLGIEVRRIDS